MNRTSQKRKPGERGLEIGDGEGFYTKSEMARLLKVSIRSVTKMMRRGLLPYLRWEGTVRFRLEDVNRRLSETCLFCDGAGLRPPSPVPSGHPLPKGEGQAEVGGQKKSTPHPNPSPPAPLPSDGRGWCRALPDRGREGDGAHGVTLPTTPEDDAQGLTRSTQKISASACAGAGNFNNQQH